MDTLPVHAFASKAWQEPRVDIEHGPGKRLDQLRWYELQEAGEGNAKVGMMGRLLFPGFCFALLFTKWVGRDPTIPTKNATELGSNPTERECTLSIITTLFLPVPSFL
eukprot:1145310-Pelagomonas_calceolata.AAC.1